MFYDSEADLERALMSIDHLVKSTLRKRATQGREKEAMDVGGLIELLTPKVPTETLPTILRSLKFAWDMRDMYKIKLMADAQRVLKRFGVTHPKLEEAARLWNSATPEEKQRAEQIRQQRRQARSVERDRKSARKRQKAARRKQRDREDEFSIAAWA